MIVGITYGDDGMFKSDTYLLYDKAVGYGITSQDETKTCSTGKTVLKTDILYLKDNNKLVLGVNYTGISDYCYNNKYKIPIGKFDVLNVTDLYYSRALFNNLIVTAGIVNFETGSFNNTGLYNAINGIGIYGLVDFELEALLLSYRTKHAIITAGAISKGKYTETAYVLKTNDNTDYSHDILNAFNGSNGYALLINSMITSELTLDFNFYKYNEILMGIKSKKLYLAGLDLKYDRTETLGDVFYLVLSASRTKGDSTEFREHDNGGYPYSNAYYGKYDVNGYSAIAGYAKTFDSMFFNREIQLGIEGKYVSCGYDNLSVGMPISIEINSALGWSYKTYLIATIKRNFLFKFVYGEYLNGTNKTTQLHGVPVTSTIDDKTLTSKSMRAFSFGFIYKF
jgi:hypothetical protein